MSIRLPAPPDATEPDGDIETSSSSSEDDDNDENWDEWISDSITQQECRSLFEKKSLPSAEEALKYDKQTYGFDLIETCGKLCEFISPAQPAIRITECSASSRFPWPCPTYQLHPEKCWWSSSPLFWLLNIEQNPTSNDLADLQGTEPWFSTDEYLLPALENDPLIREVILLLATLASDDLRF